MGGERERVKMGNGGVMGGAKRVNTGKGANMGKGAMGGLKGAKRVKE